MDVHLIPDQEAFVRQAIASRRLQRAEEAAYQALSLWEKRERNRMEILAALDAAEASIACSPASQFSGGGETSFLPKLALNSMAPGNLQPSRAAALKSRIVSSIR
jgi:hypothetical protein